MVERVARAIAASRGGEITGPSRHRASDEFGWDVSGDYRCKYVESHWREHVHAAEFAIEAMREPQRGAPNIEEFAQVMDNLIGCAESAMRLEGGEGYWAVEDARTLMLRWINSKAQRPKSPNR